MKDQNEAALDLLLSLHSSRVPGSKAASYREHRDCVITTRKATTSLRDRMPCPPGRWAPGLRAVDRGRGQRPGNEQRHTDRELATASLLQERGSAPHLTEEETALSPHSSQVTCLKSRSKPVVELRFNSCPEDSMSRALTTEPCPLVTKQGSGETEGVMGQLEQRDGWSGGCGD